MPAATPLPRGPSVLSLYGVSDLLTAPGCPVCRYAAEASDRYLGWFALEGHSQPDLITTLSAALGMCARHTRGLMSQPGAATRLTAVYRYVLTGVRGQLAAGKLSPAACPACTHDDAAGERALDTLLDGLSDTGALRQCQHLGGICLPHLSAAAEHGPRRIAESLAETMRESLAAYRAGYQWLAGTDYDAETRVRLRQTIPASSETRSAACGICQAAAQAERDSLAQVTAVVAGSPDNNSCDWPSLCAGHLADAVIMSNPDQHQALLARQFRSLAAGWRPPGAGIRPPLAARLSRSARRRRSGDCPVCCESSDAALRALASAGRAVREASAAGASYPVMCVRHQAVLRGTDRQASRALSRDSVAAAGELIAELAEAFELGTWAGRRDAGMPRDSSSWRQAAAFLNGGVFAGLRR